MLSFCVIARTNGNVSNNTYKKNCAIVFSPTIIENIAFCSLLLLLYVKLLELFGVFISSIIFILTYSLWSLQVIDRFTLIVSICFSGIIYAIFEVGLHISIL